MALKYFQDGSNPLADMMKGGGFDMSKLKDMFAKMQKGGGGGLGKMLEGLKNNPALKDLFSKLGKGKMDLSKMDLSKLGGADGPLAKLFGQMGKKQGA